MLGLVFILVVFQASLKPKPAGSTVNIVKAPPQNGGGGGGGGSSGSEDINVYDADTQQPITLIDWGTLNPGQTGLYDALIVNSDPSKTYTLTVTASEWNPENATDYVAFSYYDYGQTLQTQMHVWFTLRVFENCTADFSFSFTITLTFEEVG